MPKPCTINPEPHKKKIGVHCQVYIKLYHSENNSTLKLQFIPLNPKHQTQQRDKSNTAISTHEPKSADLKNIQFLSTWNSKLHTHTSKKKTEHNRETSENSLLTLNINHPTHEFPNPTPTLQTQQKNKRNLPLCTLAFSDILSRLNIKF